MEEGKVKSGNKGLVVLLGVLGVAIVGLVVGIVVVEIVGNGNENVETTMITPEICAHIEGYNAVEECVNGVYSVDNNVPDFVEAYRFAIDAAKDRGDYEEASKIVSARSDDLSLIGQCDEAMALLDVEDFEGYDLGDLAYIYSRAVDTSVECGDEIAEEKWNGKLMEAIGGDASDEKYF